MKRLLLLAIVVVVGIVDILLSMRRPITLLSVLPVAAVLGLLIALPILCIWSSSVVLILLAGLERLSLRLERLCTGMK